jgi:hypothetical protein
VLSGTSRHLGAQTTGTIQATAYVVAVPVSERAAALGLRMAAAPSRAHARRELPDATVLVDTVRDTTALRPPPRITIIHW